MSYETLPLSTGAPVLSWAGHELGPQEMAMARNVASLPFVFKHVSLMPDVHLGKGALVGSVIATKEAVIPAAVGVDIGCFSAGTSIPSADGKSYPIGELAEKGEPIPIYSRAPSGYIVEAEAIARLTRRDAPLVKVTLDNGEEIACTPDHPFLVGDGSYVEASRLHPGTSLVPFYPKTTPAVVSVEDLDRREDVYCLGVPEYNNFALSAGVFVHNCGMAAIKLPYNAGRLEGKLKKIRLDVEASIPVGFAENKEIDREVRDWAGWKEFKNIHEGVRNLEAKALKQMGSLGGGNHFIEVCLDGEENIWLMLHSGSRGIGNQLAQCHIATAKNLARLADGKLPDPDLAYFVTGTREFETYWHDLQWSQEYARFNREVMMARFKKIVEKYLAGGKPTKPLLAVNCHHNYAEKEVHFGEEVYITRKGAVRARETDHGIIPGSMGARSYIVKGKGNQDSFCSCSHGAGRLMSRNLAKKTFTLDDLIEQTKGVECRKDEGVIDEIPGAYKPIEQVMERQSDLVEVVATLKQVMCVKG
jgi:tRNA-splicing ligase RtcB